MENTQRFIYFYFFDTNETTIYWIIAKSNNQTTKVAGKETRTREPELHKDFKGMSLEERAYITKQMI
jgi:hypothetical protein